MTPPFLEDLVLVSSYPITPLDIRLGTPEEVRRRRRHPGSREIYVIFRLRSFFAGLAGWLELPNAESPAPPVLPQSAYSILLLFSHASLPAILKLPASHLLA